MKCITCKNEKKTFTREHIVPEGLGCSLIINRVFKECNDYLGYNVDSMLVNNWLIEIKSLFIKLKVKERK
ncbi:MAG: hypothetical protein CVV28_11305 [Methanobacteriales archaeon HGW-Methanobacteriales-1]|jgi:hypothetical protein|nr:MAG: hypothetical protein CVV28_11305 [Methanobacteriales archaeon HGW-Methanobacteriales-1]